MVVSNEDYSKYDLALCGVKNSERHVWLAFANYQHEAKERIKYLPALEGKAILPVTAGGNCATTQLLCSAAGADRAPTVTQRGWLVSGNSNIYYECNTVACLPQLYSSCDFSMARAAILWSGDYYFTHSLIIQLLEECPVTEGVCSHLGGSAPGAGDVAGRNTVSRGHSIIPQGKVCSHCFAWSVFAEQFATIHSAANTCKHKIKTNICSYQDNELFFLHASLEKGSQK